MEVSKELVGLYTKLVKVRKAVPYLQKAERGQQYAYVGSSQVLTSLREKLDEEGLLLIPNVIKTNLITKDGLNSKGQPRTTYLTELWMEYTWVDSETGAKFTVPFYAQGVDFEGEKGVGKALTYAEKYFLLKQFNIATDKDDPDRHQQKIDSTVPKYISEQQTKELYGYMEQFAKYKNVPVDSIIQTFNVTSIEKIQLHEYKNIRETILSWLVPFDNQPQGQNQTVYEQPQVNEQPPQNVPVQDAPPQYVEQTQSQPMGNITHFVITNVEEGITPNNVPYMRVTVINTESNVEQLLIANTEEGMNIVRQLPTNTPIPILTSFENGFTMFKGVA